MYNITLCTRKWCEVRNFAWPRIQSLCVFLSKLDNPSGAKQFY